MVHMMFLLFKLIFFKLLILIKNILQISALKNKERVNQSVKLLCTVLGRIMPTDLSAALHLFLAAETAVRYTFSFFILSIHSNLVDEALLYCECLMA